MAEKSILAMSEGEFRELDLTTLTAAELVEYGERASWSKKDLEHALKLRQMLLSTDPNSVRSQRYVDEFRALWDQIGGSQMAVSSTPQELVERAERNGATERQVNSFLMLQQTLKEVEEGVERLHRDPVYAAQVEREVALLERWAEQASKPQNGLAYKLGRLLGKVFR